MHARTSPVLVSKSINENRDSTFRSVQGLTEISHQKQEKCLLSVSPTESKVHMVRNLTYSVYFVPSVLEQCLAHDRYSINILKPMNKQQPTFIDCLLSSRTLLNFLYVSFHVL